MGNRYIKDIGCEWHEDGEMDFWIELDVEILKDPKYGFKYILLDEKRYEIKDDPAFMFKNEEYIETDTGTFYCREGRIWIWAIPEKQITEGTRRRSIGKFYLTTSEGDDVPGTSTWEALKKEISPKLNRLWEEERTNILYEKKGIVRL